MKNLKMDIINLRKKPECSVPKRYFTCSHASVCGATLRFDYGVWVACGIRNAIRFLGFLSRHVLQGNIDGDVTVSLIQIGSLFYNKFKGLVVIGYNLQCMYPLFGFIQKFGFETQRWKWKL